jgi:ABC-type branched-subunit amino acid transport system ATPase component
MEAILSIQNACKKFGELQAVDDVSLEVFEGETTGIIGPNGSGKTTLLNLISGIYSCSEGSIFFNKKRIDRLSPYQISSRGVGRTFQITRVFKQMSVLENMFVAGYVSRHKYRDKVAIENKAMELLKLVGLTGLQHEQAQNLSGGQQKLLELARVLMTDPKILLADEPFAGVNPAVKQRLFNTIQKLNAEEKLTCLVISHDLPSITELCKKIMVLSAGRKIAEGETKQILTTHEVVEAYLGEKRVRG